MGSRLSGESSGDNQVKVKILKFSEDQNLLRLGKSQGGSSDDGQVTVR